MFKCFSGCFYYDKNVIGDDIDGRCAEIKSSCNDYSDDECGSAPDGVININIRNSLLGDEKIFFF
jgi:hypothetical protein